MNQSLWDTLVNFFGGLSMIAFCVFCIYLAIMWIVLPLYVIAACRRLKMVTPDLHALAVIETEVRTLRLILANHLEPALPLEPEPTEEEAPAPVEVPAIPQTTPAHRDFRTHVRIVAPAHHA